MVEKRLVYVTLIITIISLALGTTLGINVFGKKKGTINSPAYDSGWVLSNGQVITLTHNLGTTEVFVYFIGSDVDDQEYITHNGYGYFTEGPRGGTWGSLDTTHINVYGKESFKWVRVMIWIISDK